MNGRGGRDRFRRRSPPPPQTSSFSSSRFSEKSRPAHPPSRHLWIGNLSNHVTESDLADRLLQFGDLESLAFQPGRSYAFVNYKRDDDAIAAMNSLQGYSVAGAALRIEFAKADKMSATTRDDNYMNRRDEMRSRSRDSPFSQREPRINQGGSDAFLPEGSRASDSSTESPSKVLWISYPTFLKVDETALERAFSPFGEIEKISVFQGRNYAFVSFRSLMSACRAKETLHGKLFGSPKVHICFARSESGSSTNGRQVSRINSPNFKTSGRAGSSDNFQLDRNFRNLPEPRSSYLPPELDYRDPDAMNFRRDEPFRNDQRRFHDLGPEMGPSDDLRGYHAIPGRAVPEFHKLSPPRFRKRSPYAEEPWDLPEDPHLSRESKKLRTTFPAENELPEYRFSDLDRGKHSFRPAHSDMLDEAGPLSGFRRDHPVNSTRPFADRSDHLLPPRDSFQSAPGSFSTNLHDQKRVTPDMPPPSVNKEWKWEGTLAKGGNAICRARCLPVGKVLDFPLPEYLDCTARTGLDMLAKHYYQASAAWVVFFVPHGDADISYYNEFLNYLGEKQRAAVSKLDDRNTLFLVPPSDFSEKVLKVPGKLSISGVILRLEPPTPATHSLPPAQERREINPNPLHSNISYPPGFSSPNITKPGFESSSAPPSRFSSYDHDYTKQGPIHPTTQEYQRSGQDPNISGPYNYNTSRTSSSHLPDQLAQLTSSLLGQQQRQQPGSSSSVGMERFSGGYSGQSENPGSQRYAPIQMNQGPPGFSALPQFQQQEAQMQHQMGSNVGGNNGGDGQEGEGDPQKRLQATLQLAATLLQQIQQGK